MTVQDAVFHLLDQQNVPYTVVFHKPVFTVAEIDFETPGSQVKNLLLKGRHQYYLLIISDTDRVDMTQLARDLNEKKLSFADPSILMVTMKLKPGSVTPFGLINDTEGQVKLLVDNDIDRQALIGFHPNVNTATVILRFPDFVAVMHLIHKPVQYVSAAKKAAQ